MERKTGARALRAILEKAMVDIMFESPSMKNVDTCVITEDVIQKGKKPIYKKIRKSA